jgi:adenylate kinase family enzyme
VQRVLILGPGGSGKSELAREIGRRTGLRVIHLDVVFWQEGWTPTPREEAIARLTALVATDCWILDGNFLVEADAHERFARADTVIWLDLPRAVCLWRIARRLVRHRHRPDLPDGCHETFDPEGIRWIWNYPKTDRPVVRDCLASVSPQAEVLHFTSRADVKEYLNRLH